MRQCLRVCCCRFEISSSVLQSLRTLLGSMTSQTLAGREAGDAWMALVGELWYERWRRDERVQLVLLLLRQTLL